MTYGIIYNKDPMICMEILDNVNDAKDSYIVMHSLNQKGWHKLLSGKKIDPNRVHGIGLSSLEQFGAITPASVEPFTTEQIFYIWGKKFNHPHESLEEIIGIIRKHKCSTPDLMKFNYQSNQLLESLSSHIR